MVLVAHVDCYVGTCYVGGMLSFEVGRGVVCCRWRGESVNLLRRDRRYRTLRLRIDLNNFVVSDSDILLNRPLVD